MVNRWTIVGLLVLCAGTAAIEREKRGQTVPESNITPDSLLSEADAIFQHRDFENALRKYEEAADRAREEFNRSVEAEATAQMARLNLVLGKTDLGQVLLGQAAILTSESDPMGWSRYLSVKGRFEWKEGHLDTAHQTFEQMYAYCNTNALWGRAVDAANMLAIVSSSPDEQIEWSRRGIEAAEASNSETLLGPLWNNLAVTYFDQGEYDSALECFTKSREFHWKNGGEIQKLFADYHIGMTYRFLGQLDEAAQWLRPVLAWAERLENHSAIGQALEDLGEIAIARGQKAEGVAMLKQARDHFRKVNFEAEAPDAWKKLNQRIEKLGG